MHVEKEIPFCIPWIGVFVMENERCFFLLNLDLAELIYMEYG
jgi:hypothetical protein